MKKLVTLLLITIVLVTGYACSKTDIQPAPVPPPPYLTGKTWTLDTITINPPATYASLTDAEKFDYNATLGWFTNAELFFNADGTMRCGGDWDFGYQQWQLANSGADIKVTPAAGDDTMRAWVANSSSFTYVSLVGGTVHCTFIYK